MKKLLTILAALIISASNVAQAQDCLWAKSEGGISPDNDTKVCADVSGNIYVTGRFFSSTITFGATTLNNFGQSDIFVTKYTSDGTLIWTKSAGGNGMDICKSVSTDPSGNVYITGSFSSTFTIGSTTLTSAGSSDAFLVKYDPNGTFLWAKSAGGTFTDYGQSISTDSSGNLYVTGNFESPTITFGSTTLSNEGREDIFIVKYSPDGAVLWAKAAAGNEYDKANGISTDVNGSVYVVGRFNSTTITFGTTNLINADNSDGTNDIFITKFASDGSVLWAKSVGGLYDEDGSDVSTDPSGNVFITGNFSSPVITFGTTTLFNTENGANSYSDIFIAKYTPNGTFIWAKSAVGNGYDIGQGISTDAIGNVFVTGSFYGSTITFGTTTIVNTDIGTNDNSDIFIAKYSGVSTGTSESSANNQLIISPNPTNSSITLSMPSLKNSKISITTLTGTEVGNYNTENTSTQTIDISHLASGVYFVSLKSEEGVLTKKIIKQ
jgi:hypothetical protein